MLLSTEDYKMCPWPITTTNLIVTDCSTVHVLHGTPGSYHKLNVVACVSPRFAASITLAMETFRMPVSTT